MSLQSDFERCLLYAKKLEKAEEEQIASQEDIIYIRNESERLKKKWHTCAAIAFASVLIIIFLLNTIITKKAVNLISITVVLGIVFVVSAVILIKTLKESLALESTKDSRIKEDIEDAAKWEREIEYLAKEIYDKNLTDIVPAEYFSVAAIEFCISAVRKKLATTDVEVFRLLDNEIKRMEHRVLLEEMHEARIEQLESIKEAIDTNTMVTWAEYNRNRR